MSQDIVFAGVRTILENGDSMAVTPPKRELESLGVEMEDATEECVPVVLSQDGKMTIDFSELAD